MSEQTKQQWREVYGVSTLTLAGGAMTISVEYTSEGYKIVIYSYKVTTLKLRVKDYEEAKRTGIAYAKHLLSLALKELEAA